MHRILSFALCLFTAHGCSEPRPTSETTSSTSSASDELAEGSTDPAVEAPPPATPLVEAEEGQIRGGLGAHWVTVVESAERVQITRMARRCLRDGDDPDQNHEYFVQCPIVSPLVDLDLSAATTQELISAVLDDESYRFDVRVRCNSDHENVGLRFTRGEEHIDYFLISCQTGFLVRDGADERRVEAVITDEHRERLVAAAPAT